MGTLSHTVYVLGTSQRKVRCHVAHKEKERRVIGAMFFEKLDSLFGNWLVMFVDSGLFGGAKPIKPFVSEGDIDVLIEGMSTRHKACFFKVVEVSAELCETVASLLGVVLFSAEDRSIACIIRRLGHGVDIVRLEHIVIGPHLASAHSFTRRRASRADHTQVRGRKSENSTSAMLSMGCSDDLIPMRLRTAPCARLT